VKGRHARAGISCASALRDSRLDDLERVAVVTVPALLSVASVARLLDCSSRTVRRRIDDGSLPAVVDHGRLMVRGDELRIYVDELERVGASAARSSRRRRAASGRYPDEDAAPRLVTAYPSA
jgi:excisionase family DNA binding protein